MKKFIFFSVCLLIGQLIVFRIVENHNRTWGTLSVLIIGYFFISFFITLVFNGIQLLLKNKGRGFVFITAVVNILLLIILVAGIFKEGTGKNMIYILSCFFETTLFMLYATIYLINKTHRA
jgi:hypothetical protein